MPTRLRALALLSTAAAVTLSPGVRAQSSAEPTLDAVVVKGEVLNASPNQPFSTQLFAGEEFRERQVSNPQQLFREVPGMEVRGLGYGSVADSIVLRGFSGGGHGGDIGFVLDGLPLNEASSHADGYADMGLIIPLELRSMRVFKGPVSALHGNFNRAGVIALESRKGGAYREVDARLGSNRTIDLQAVMGAKLGGASLNVAAQSYSTDGYRPQTGAERANLAGRVTFDLSPSTQLAVSGRLHSGRADTASIITQAQYNDRGSFFSKNPNVQNDGADKAYASLRGDLSHSLSPQLRALFFAYGTHQTFSRYFTRLTNAVTWQQRSEDYDRDVRGYGVNLNGDQRILGKPFKWVAGVERYEEDTLFKYADALNNRNFTAATLTAGVAGGAGTLDRRLSLETVSLLGQAEWALDPLFRPTIGFRRDRLSGGCERRGVETRAGASAQCGSMPTFTINTPKLGVRSTLAPGLLEARASLSEGFALPGDAAKFTAGLAVQPTLFRQKELGVTLTPGSNWLVDIARYRIDSRDEVALTDPVTLTYSNIGKTRREGTEAEIRFYPVHWFEASAALSRFRSAVTETLPATPFLLGSEVAGVPKTMATLTATVRPAKRYALTGIVRSIGRHAVNQPGAATSAVYYEGYRTVDLMASYEAGRAGDKRRRLFAQIANLTNRYYAASSGVTAGVQTYNPAAPRTVTVGVSVDL